MRTILSLLIISIALGLRAQGEERKPGLVGRYLNSVFNEPGDPADAKLIIYPSLGYAPETSWEFGFSTLFVYYAKKDTAKRLSDVSGFVFYKLETQ